MVTIESAWARMLSIWDRVYSNYFRVYDVFSIMRRIGLGFQLVGHTICKNERLDEENEKINNYWERINDKGPCKRTQQVIVRPGGSRFRFGPVKVGSGAMVRVHWGGGGGSPEAYTPGKIWNFASLKCTFGVFSEKINEKNDPKLTVKMACV